MKDFTLKLRFNQRKSKYKALMTNSILQTLFATVLGDKPVGIGIIIKHIHIFVFESKKIRLLT
jgi:hypothetical protein